MGSEVREATLMPLLLGDRGRGITFVVDSSESATTVLGSVKWLLIQTLLRKAAFRDSLFNIVTFSGHVSLVFNAVSEWESLTAEEGLQPAYVAASTKILTASCEYQKSITNQNHMNERKFIQLFKKRFLSKGVKTLQIICFFVMIKPFKLSQNCTYIT